MYAAPHVRTQIDRRHLAQRRIDTAKSLHDPRSGETISQNAKATLGRDKQHLEEEKEIEVAKAAGRCNTPETRPADEGTAQRSLSG